MYISIIVGLAAFAAAAPVSKRHDKEDSTYYQSSFDDISPVLGEAPIQEVGPYNGLLYKSIDVITVGLDGEPVLAGVKPHSPPNAGVYSLITAAADESEPYITTQYSGSVTETFDFKSFWFGCEKALGVSLLAMPLSCNITVTGLKDTKEIATQTFEYIFQTVQDLEDLGEDLTGIDFKSKRQMVDLSVDMVEAKLSPEFKDLDTVLFSTVYDYDFIDGYVGATLVDDLEYKVYYGEGKKDVHEWH